ncbi:hypothetical protein DESPIG_01408 [Desulfovibrio piger ATCC 29098]|uniref:Uncharacterized protein n=1 Tax=Desulfovibrio piger ATCC 29098 TaxID=411464 RepID=B6WTK2_9BACT|nr:hypothetical protein DESPIG_01408 [Desulfovibrio piger ATCC 29098]
MSERCWGEQWRPFAVCSARNSVDDAGPLPPWDSGRRPFPPSFPGSLSFRRAGARRFPLTAPPLVPEDRRAAP